LVAFVAAAAGCVVGAGCGGGSHATAGTTPIDPDAGTTVASSVCVASDQLPDLDQLHVRYDPDDGADPVALQITTDDLAGLAAVDADAANAQVDVRFGEGPDSSSATASATMRQRGLTVRSANQKSYRIKLAGGSPLWRGERVINLNKHPWDLTRVRQKLSFQLFRTVPHFASLDTRFVQVYVNGDYRGLYTTIENPDENYLAAHGLPQGTVYSPVFFDFAPIPDDYWNDPSKLGTIIEAKTAADTAKLRKMIEAVNDPSTPINDVVSRFFNRQNYETWLAINVLVGNWDQGASNFLIYSPAGCDGWYFLPWDYDGAWDWYHQVGADPTLLTRWRAGLTVYWGSALHARFLRDPANVAEVEAVMQALGQGILDDAAVSALLDRFHDAVSAAVSVAPDVYYLPTAMANVMVSPAVAFAGWQAEYDRIRGVATQYQKEYQQVRTRPAPIPIDSTDMGASLSFTWGASYSFQGDPLSYDFQLSKSTAFRPQDMVVEMPGLTIPGGGMGSLVIPKPAAGTYDWRVVVRDQKTPTTDWQIPFDVYHQITVAK
jgi:spore coat protein H